MKFKIENKTIECGKWYQKYFWYIYIQIRYILWKFTKEKGEVIFFENNTVKNLHIKKWEIHVFWFAIYTHVTLKMQGKLKNGLQDIDIEEMK